MVTVKSSKMQMSTISVFLLGFAVLSNAQCFSKIEFKNCKASEHDNPMWNLHNSHRNYFRLELDRACSKMRLSFHWVLREKASKKRVMNFPAFKQMSVLAIQSGVLGFGQYILEVTATHARSGSVKTVECWINSVRRVPILILLGGHLRTAHRGERISLDASLSVESGVQNLQYIWNCTSSPGQHSSCQNLKKFKGKITTLKIEAKPKTTYTITLTLSAKNFTKSEKQQIKVVDRSAPRLEIKCEKNCPAKGTFESYLYMRLFLRAMCLKNCVGARYEWKVDPSVQDLNLPNSPKLILLPDKFKMNKEYKFSVTVSKNNTASVKAMMVIMTCGTPTQNGACTAEPSEGISLKTLFKITCTNFNYRRPLIKTAHQDDVILTQDTASEFILRLAAPIGRFYIEFRDDTMVQTNYYLPSPIKVNPLFTGMDLNEIIKETLKIYKGDSEYVDSVKYLAETGRTEEAVQVIYCLLKELQALNLNDALKKFKREFYVMVVKDMLEFPTGVMPYGIISLLPKFMDIEPNLEFTFPYIKLCYKMAYIVLDEVKKAEIPFLHWRTTESHAYMIINSVPFVLDSDYYKIASFAPTTQKTIEQHAVAEEDYPDYKDVMDTALTSQCAKITDHALEALRFCTHAFALTLAYGENIARAGTFSQIVVQVDAVKVLRKNITFRQKLIATLPRNLGLKHEENIRILLISTDNKAFAWNERGKKLSTRVVGLNLFDEKENRVRKLPQNVDYYLPIEKGAQVKWETVSESGPVDLKQWDLKVFRVEISRGSNLLVEFQGISSEFQVVILKGRRPNLKDFNNAKVVSDGQTILTPSTSEDTFYYVAALPTTNSEIRSGRSLFAFIGNLLRLSRQTEVALSYKYRFMTQKCLEWYGEKWQAAKCVIGSKSSAEQIHCQCNLVSALSGYMDMVNVKVDDILPISYKLTLEVQYVVYITTLIVFGVYCVLLCFAILRINSGKNHIYFLGDNVLDDRYGYFIIVKTGNCISASTTSNIVIKLHGTKNNSKPHVLNYPDPDKKILQQNNTDWFLLSTTEHLGEIIRLELWFDSIGERPSWYCESIRVYDLQSDGSWLFVVQSWFNLLHGIYYTDIKPGIENDSAKKSSVFHNLRVYLGREHTWNLINSLDDRKLHYTERLSVILSHILCTYSLVLLLCMTPSIRLADGFNRSFIHSYYSILGISVGISVATFLINTTFVFVFRHSSRKHETDVEMKSELFPSEAIRYAWWVLIGVIVVNLIYLVLFGFWISYKASLIWLIISSVAIVLDIFILENIYLSLYIIWENMLLKKIPKITVYDFGAIIEESERQRRHLFNKMSRFALRPYLVPLYSPLTRENFLKKRQRLLMRLAIGESFRDMVTLIIQILILFILLLTQLNSMSSTYNKHMYDMIAGAKFGGTKPLTEVHTIGDIYDYINETLIPTLHSMNWYGEWFATDPGLMSDFTTKVLGVARIRQQRVKLKGCRITDFMVKINVTVCNPELSWTTGDTKSDGSIWYYYTSRESGYMVTFGDMKRYFGGGYISLLGRTLSNAYYKLQFLKENRWIDARTRGLFIEFWTYNANLNLFNAAKVIFERSATQLVLTNSQIFTAKLTSGDFGFELFTSIVLTLFMVIMAYQVIKCSVRVIKSPKTFFKDIWKILDLLIILTSISVICMFMIRSLLVNRLLTTLEKSKNNEFVNYFAVISFAETLKIIIALLICVMILRLWRFLRFMLKFRIFERTLLSAAISLCVIFVYNLLLLFMFALSGYVAFGAISKDYRNVLITFTNMILLSLNLNQHFDFEILANYNPVIGKVYYLAFMFIMLVLFSVYITVIILYYEESDAYFSNKILSYSIKDYVLDEWNYICQLIIRRVRHIRLHGGQEFPTVSYFKIYRKTDDKRYANCRQIPVRQMERMKNIAKGVLYNSYLRKGKSDDKEKEFRIMQDVITGLASTSVEGDDLRKARFFVARIGDCKAKFVPNERLLQMEAHLKRLLSLRQQDLIKDNKSLEKIKNMERFASKLNTIVGNINVTWGKNKKL